MAEPPKVRFVACPGCGFVGGAGITKNGRYWHADCWSKRLELALAQIAGVTDDRLGIVGRAGVADFRRIAKDALNA